jgi:anaerobic dimethyl sulfoxide reductase subunit A
LGEYIVPQNDTSYGKGVEIKYSTGPYNCGSKCLYKIHIKNGRMLRMTSEGDIPRAASDTAKRDECSGHEAFKPSQRRACVRGYGEIQHNYQPNRLKYPLFQTLERGNLAGFKRVSWDWAIDRLATEIKAAADRRGYYGYLPIHGAMESTVATLVNDNKSVIVKNFDHSTGSVECARFDGVGMGAMGNVKSDRYNTKFLICWALDPSRTTYYQINALWIHTKLKEDNIPLVFVMSTLNDSASITGTGATINTTINPKTNMAYNYNYKGFKGDVKIPRWLACRPTTDGALTVAMMYVLYKNELYDETYLQDSTFGFFPNLSYSGSGKPGAPLSRNTEKTNNNNYDLMARVRASIPLIFPDDVTDTSNTGVITAPKSKGDKLGDNVEYKLPDGASFVEYLDSLEDDWALGALTAQEKYDGVLEYAAALTGIKPQYIEALAMKYAEPSLTGNGAAMIDLGGGANRAYNGPESAWLQICLTAMCGYIDKPGGSCGISMMSNPEDFALGDTTYSLSMIAPSYGIIAVNGLNFLHIPISGTDGRTAEQIIADVKFQTGVDVTTFQHYIDTNKPLHFEVVGFGYTDISNHTNFVQTHPNIHKNRLGLTDPSVKFSYMHDNVMTPTAANCDLVFPEATHFESPNTYANYSISAAAYFLVENMHEPLYEARTGAYLSGALRAKVLEKFGAGDGLYTPPPPASLDDVKDAYDSVPLSDVWRDHPGYDASYKPDWNTLRTEGKIDIVSPKDNPIIGFRDVNPPRELCNSTGLINFYSPFWHIRMRMSITGGTRGAEEDLGLLPLDISSGGGRLPGVTESPSGKYYGPGWRTATAKYIPVPGGYESMFDNLNPKTGNFVGYTSPLSRRTYKMLYMTNKSRNRAHTAFDSTAIIKDQYKQHAKINPATAAERGIKNGDLVYVYNDRGCTKIPAELTHQILPGYVSIEHGAWYRPHPNETVTVWQKNRLNAAIETKTVPVDVGGADNVLTDDDNTLDTPFCAQTLAAQTGPCEVSIVKPI